MPFGPGPGPGRERGWIRRNPAHVRVFGQVGLHGFYRTSGLTNTSGFVFPSSLYCESQRQSNRQEFPLSLFRLDASIRTEGSVSRAIADIVEQSWRGENPNAVVTRRHVGVEPIPSTSWALSVHANRGDVEKLSSEQRIAIALAATLTDELLDADAMLFAIPLYNFGVSQHFKAWVDLVTTDPRMASSAGQPMKGRPAVLVVVRGGSYGAGTPREGWDHATGWIRRILEDVWGLDLRMVETEFTLVGVNPALDQFKDLAASLRRESERVAAEIGRHLWKERPTPSVAFERANAQ